MQVHGATVCVLCLPGLRRPTMSLIDDARLTEEEIVPIIGTFDMGGDYPPTTAGMQRVADAATAKALWAYPAFLVEVCKRPEWSYEQARTIGALALMLKGTLEAANIEKPFSLEEE